MKSAANAKGVFECGTEKMPTKRVMLTTYSSLMDGALRIYDSKPM